MKRIPSLDRLDAISTTLVVVGHWMSVCYSSQLALSYAILGVLIFFIISGFLITTLLLKEHAKASTISLRNFYVRRAYRILPAAAGAVKDHSATTSFTHFEVVMCRRFTAN